MKDGLDKQEFEILFDVMTRFSFFPHFLHQ